MGRSLLLLALVSAALVVPASALAAADGLVTNCDSGGQNCTMVYDATGDGTTANVAVVSTSDFGGGTYEVHDPNTTINAQSPCFQGPDPQTMACPTNIVARLQVELGAGDDAVQVVPDLPSTIEGGAGSDTIVGGPANDTIDGDTAGSASSSDGNDMIEGGQGNDTENGEGGNDTFIAESGPDGADQVFGGDGTDTATYALRTAPQTLSLDDVANDGQDGGNDNIHSDVENLVGGSGSDVISGSDAANALDGGAGDDSIAGGNGNDTLTGDAGNDTENGGSGDDSESGGAGADTLAGGDGADSLAGGDGNDNEDGGTGNDTESGDTGDDSLTGGAGQDSLSGGDGTDTLDGGADSDTLSGDAGNDTESGGDGADSLNGGTGDDSLDGGTGPDVMAGGDGTDLGDYSSRTAPLTVTLDGNAGDGEAGENDNVEPDVENLHGGAGADTFIGSAAANSLDGGGGENYEDGGGGADTFIGGSSGDVFRTRGSTEGAQITCGPGPDFVIAKPSDVVSADCDRVDRGVNQKPKLRDSEVVAPARGQLQMSPTGIVRRVPLQDKVVLPLQSIVDTVTGSVSVTSALTRKKVQTVELDSGAFSLGQLKGKLAVPQFSLAGGDFTPCGTAARATGRAHAAATRSHQAIRRLWASGKGQFRTRGRYAAATVRGTRWLTEDRCDGTLIRVTSGRVAVQDLVAHKTVVVKRGRSYFAAATRRR